MIHTDQRVALTKSTKTESGSRWRDNPSAMSQTEVAEQLGISRQRVNQLEISALRKLKKRLRPFLEGQPTLEGKPVLEEGR